MPFRISLADAVLCAAVCLALSGCVTEPGRTGPALWTSIVTDTSDHHVPLKNPVRIHTTFARMAEGNGKRTVARKHYRKALSHNPKAVNAIVGIARLDQHAGHMKNAERGFQKALKLAPKNPDVLQSAALFYASQNRWRDAIRYLNAARAAAPNVAEHRYLLAVVMTKSGDYNGAMPHYTATVGRAKGHNEIGHSLFQRGSHREAEQQIRIALSLNPNLASARRLLARLQNRDQDQGHSPRNIVRRPVQTTNNGPIRSVGHTARPNGLGRPSAWRHGDNQSPRRTLRVDTGNLPVPSPSGESNRFQEPRQLTLNISPGTRRRLQNDDPFIKPQASVNPADFRGRAPDTIDSQYPIGVDPNAQQIPQWNH